MAIIWVVTPMPNFEVRRRGILLALEATAIMAPVFRVEVVMSANCGSGLPACGPEMRRADRRLEARCHNAEKPLIGAPEFLPDVSQNRRRGERLRSGYRLFELPAKFLKQSKTHDQRRSVIPAAIGDGCFDEALAHLFG